jgi:hypothetical protein
MVTDELRNLENDDFEERIKMGDFGEKVRQWFFTPMQRGDYDSRRVDQSEYKEVEFQLSLEIFGAKEELFQQYIKLGGGGR